MGTARVRIYRDRLPGLVRKETINDRTEIAEEIANDARSRAPVLTGAYRSGISVEVNGTQVHVVDNDDTSIHKEYGTSDTPAHAALTSAASQRGRYSGMMPR